MHQILLENIQIKAMSDKHEQCIKENIDGLESKLEAKKHCNNPSCSIGGLQPLSNFNHCPRSKDGHLARCRECARLQRLKYRAETKEKRDRKLERSIEFTDWNGSSIYC